MRKIFGISLLAAACLSLPVQAAPWFNQHDHNRDGYWNWEEYRSAQMEWCRRHHVRCDETRLKNEWRQIARNERVYPNDARGLHPW